MGVSLSSGLAYSGSDAASVRAHSTFLQAVKIGAVELPLSSALHDANAISQEQIEHLVSLDQRDGREVAFLNGLMGDFGEARGGEQQALLGAQPQHRAPQLINESAGNNAAILLDLDNSQSGS